MQTLNIPQTLKLSDGGLLLKKLSTDELLRLCLSQRGEEERLSCRPVAEKSLRERRTFYKNLLKNDGVFFFGIYLLAGQKETLVGRIELSDYNSRNKSAEVGYMLLPEHRGRGHMCRAFGLLTPYLFEKAPERLNKIYAQTGDFNAPSIALLTALGFKCDGRLRQHHELGGVLHDDLVFSLCQSDLS